MTVQKKEESVNLAYIRQLMDARESLRTIAETIRLHGKGEYKHWGHVGDLVHINELLNQIISFLNNEG